MSQQTQWISGNWVAGLGDAFQSLSPYDNNIIWEASQRRQSKSSWRYLLLAKRLLSGKKDRSRNVRLSCWRLRQG